MVLDKQGVCNKLQITEKQLDLLEYDFMKVHKEYVDRIIKMKDKYEEWYVAALIEWKSKRKKLFE